ncbi:14 kDa phosphohistidine phosphatase-like [Belonocnema kinseyi]|uniref:14 kDa phosphohistidine phosphatase-like n=1 Tax=Belonocnema kinseyi TaxID=2817044 RepID=UPI00143DC386|nr:14 kDa phosphohistidine phosphatase-like [Belonocnema kinseyi]
MCFVQCVNTKVLFSIIHQNFSRVLVSRVCSKMSESLNQVPDVDIDDNGVFKYILINVEDKKSKIKKPIVRGYSRAGYHGEFLNAFI